MPDEPDYTILSSGRTRRYFITASVMLLLFFGLEAALQAQLQSDSTMTTSRSSESQDDPRTKAWWMAIGWGTVLLVLLITCSAAIIIFSRRYKTYLVHGERTPTPNEDVWAMHRVPEELNDEWRNGADRNNGDDSNR